MGAVSSVDPRPVVVAGPAGDGLVEGRRCTACAEPSAFTWPACPTCGGPVEPARFGPGGTVWSATVVRIPVADRTPPYALAYVDLDDGPRVLAHSAAPLPIGARVRLLAAAELKVERT
ncbi:Zn-ribbon domain-containing OB-fold protein [Pseudonocardia oroxyli]|uniref:ChsH2 C-terminal OB-fold domain-containing protein n=1 Tax=Pseudonocardia oroxyli TaxID=366584 RepID=A0A1G7X7L4_PSEOR|nr:OB-fold domain-containing protein [Pseudonocardia oroxyli]SDG80136.1 hypothetical protein SAMN05216377_115110 [Pseudonocardia oroxyli]